MYIGKISTWDEYYRLTAAFKANTPQKTGLEAIAECLKSYKADKDTVTIGSAEVSDDEVGIYKPRANQMRALECNITFADRPDSPQSRQTEIMKILPASEKSYTEQDALMNQYMKQYRIEYEAGEDGSLQIRDESVKLVLPEMVSEEELESFRQKLCAEGLGTEIDWRGVEQDFFCMRAGFSELTGVDTMGAKADYLASRYAVLKERIQTQYAGEEQAAQMETLNRLYQNAKGELADTYANEIGGYYEALGEEGISEEFRSSIMAMVDGKAKAYGDYLAHTANYVKTSNPEDTWLLQDDGFMAAQLRESYAASENGTEPLAESGMESDAYGLDDLVFIGQYARELKNQIENAGHTWGIDSASSDADSNLGKALAQEKQYIQELSNSANISSKAEDLVNRVFQPYIDKYLDALDQCVDKMRQDRYWWLNRTTYIDRNVVYSSYQNALQDAQNK